MIISNIHSPFVWLYCCCFRESKQRTKVSWVETHEEILHSNLSHDTVTIGKQLHLVQTEDGRLIHLQTHTHKPTPALGGGQKHCLGISPKKIDPREQHLQNKESLQKVSLRAEQAHWTSASGGKWVSLQGLVKVSLPLCIHQLSDNLRSVLTHPAAAQV